MSLNPGQATNYSIEQNIALILQNSVQADEIVWLESDNLIKTIALHKKAEGIDTLGAAIILADLNNHPDWPHTIKPLRTKLPAFGWETLSIQMPIKRENILGPELDEIYNLAEARLKAAINFLKSKDINNIVIIGHRFSAGIAIKFIADNQQDIEGIEALIGISSFDTPWINSSLLLRELPIAYLDIFAQHDDVAVLKAAPKRLVSAKFAGQKIAKKSTTSLSAKVTELAKNKTGNVHYRQMQVNGATSHFSTHQDVLLKTIRGWLKSHEKKQDELQK